MTLKNPQKTPFFRPFLASPPRPKRGYPPSPGGNFPEIPQNYPILGVPPLFPRKGGPKKGPKSKGDLGSLVQNTKFWMRRFTPPPRGVKS